MLCDVLVDSALGRRIHIYAVGYHVGALLGTRVSKNGARIDAPNLRASLFEKVNVCRSLYSTYVLFI